MLAVQNATVFAQDAITHPKSEISVSTCQSKENVTPISNIKVKIAQIQSIQSELL